MYRNWHIEVTTRCNLECRHCLIGPKQTDSCVVEKHLETVLTNIQSLGAKTVSFTGGEPLLVDSFLKFYQYAQHLGLQPTFITNGQISEVLDVAGLNKTFETIGVSIDGTSSIHDYIRGKGCYDKAMHFMKQALAHGVNIVAYITINALNIYRLEKIMLDLIAIGVQTFHLNQLNIQGSAFDARELWLQQPYEKIWEIVARQITKVLDSDIQWVSDKSCMISSNSLYVDHFGNIYPCVELSSDRRLSISSIFADDVRERLDEYFMSIQRPTSCAYLTKSTNGVTILLNHGRCHFVKGEKCHD